jgi:hypothetical protein
VTQLTTALLRQSLLFSAGSGEVLPLQLIGLQKENDAHWLYCTVKVPRALTASPCAIACCLIFFPIK